MFSSVFECVGFCVVCRRHTYIQQISTPFPKEIVCVKLEERDICLYSLFINTIKNTYTNTIIKHHNHFHFLHHFFGIYFILFCVTFVAFVICAICNKQSFDIYLLCQIDPSVVLTISTIDQLLGQKSCAITR